MRLDLAQTPVVNILPPEDSAAATPDRFTEVLTAVEASPAVTAARENFEAAESEHQRLNAARDGLNMRGRDLVERLTDARRRIERALLAKFSGDDPEADVRSLINAMSLEREESAALSNVLGRLVEQLIPSAFVAQLCAEARLYSERADEVTAIAHARFEKTAELMRAATDFEAGISVDIRATFSGSLLAYADGLRGKAAQCRIAAESSEKRYRELTGQKGN